MPDILLCVPSNAVLDALFRQSIVNRTPGEDYLVGLRRYTELLVAELQAQVIHAERSGNKRTRKAGVKFKDGADFTFHGQHRGQQKRGNSVFYVPDQVAEAPRDFIGVAVPINYEDGAKGWGIVRGDGPLVSLRW